MKSSPENQEPPVVLRALDPETWDPGFWDRHHGAIMEQAAPRLAARRARSESMGDVLLSWSRLLVPSMAMAAGILGFLLLTPGLEEEGGVMFGVEDMLQEAWIQGSGLPVLSEMDRVGEDTFVFAVERVSMEVWP